ncbi:hypothetical protein F5B20DRAFT_56907 [Whalleya microplaca]|nr:hypothetical protein F5B20DRAFT_56907 [Whalleya microplaca]
MGFSLPHYMTLLYLAISSLSTTTNPPPVDIAPDHKENLRNISTIVDIVELRDINTASIATSFLSSYIRSVLKQNGSRPRVFPPSLLKVADSPALQKSPPKVSSPNTTHTQTYTYIGKTLQLQELTYQPLITYTYRTLSRSHFETSPPHCLSHNTLHTFECTYS